MIVADRRIMKGEPCSYCVLDWRSWKLTRISRSSLASEAQEATTGVDAMECVEIFFDCGLNPELDPRTGEALTKWESALVIDAKALYDAARKENTIQSFDDRRAGIDIHILKRRMMLSRTLWRWVSSERQYSDGLTKVSARQLLAARLQECMLRLYWDPTSQAPKKKSAQ